jgi:hypothetical protein
MSTTVLKHKRSNVQSSVPGTSDVVFGEIALNTFDGRLYFKKNDGSGEQIVTILEVTEENLAIDSSQLTYSTSNNLKNVINDLDDAIAAVASGGGGIGSHEHDDLFALIFAV